MSTNNWDTNLSVDITPTETPLQQPPLDNGRFMTGWTWNKESNQPEYGTYNRELKARTTKELYDYNPNDLTIDDARQVKSIYRQQIATPSDKQKNYQAISDIVLKDVDDDSKQRYEQNAILKEKFDNVVMPKQRQQLLGQEFIDRLADGDAFTAGQMLLNGAEGEERDNLEKEWSECRDGADRERFVGRTVEQRLQGAYQQNKQRVENAEKAWQEHGDEITRKAFDKAIFKNERTLSPETIKEISDLMGGDQEITNRLAEQIQKQMTTGLRGVDTMRSLGNSNRKTKSVFKNGKWEESYAFPTQEDKDKWNDPKFIPSYMRDFRDKSWYDEVREEHPDWDEERIIKSARSRKLKAETGSYADGKSPGESTWLEGGGNILNWDTRDRALKVLQALKGDKEQASQEDIDALGLAMEAVTRGLSRDEAEPLESLGRGIRTLTRGIGGFIGRQFANSEDEIESRERYQVSGIMDKAGEQALSTTDGAWWKKAINSGAEITGNNIETVITLGGSAAFTGAKVGAKAGLKAVAKLLGKSSAEGLTKREAVTVLARMGRTMATSEMMAGAIYFPQTLTSSLNEKALTHQGNDWEMSAKSSAGANSVAEGFNLGFYRSVPYISSLVDKALLGVKSTGLFANLARVYRGSTALRLMGLTVAGTADELVFENIYANTQEAVASNLLRAVGYDVESVEWQPVASFLDSFGEGQEDQVLGTIAYCALLSSVGAGGQMRGAKTFRANVQFLRQAGFSDQAVNHLLAKQDQADEAQQEIQEKVAGGELTPEEGAKKSYDIEKNLRDTQEETLKGDILDQLKTEEGRANIRKRFADTQKYQDEQALLASKGYMDIVKGVMKTAGVLSAKEENGVNVLTTEDADAVLKDMQNGVDVKAPDYQVPTKEIKLNDDELSLYVSTLLNEDVRNFIHVTRSAETASILIDSIKNMKGEDGQDLIDIRDTSALKPGEKMHDWLINEIAKHGGLTVGLLEQLSKELQTTSELTTNALMNEALQKQINGLATFKARIRQEIDRDPIHAKQENFIIGASSQFSMSTSRPFLLAYGGVTRTNAILEDAFETYFKVLLQNAGGYNEKVPGMINDTGRAILKGLIAELRDINDDLKARTGQDLLGAYIDSKDGEEFTDDQLHLNAIEGMSHFMLSDFYINGEMNGLNTASERIANILDGVQLGIASQETFRKAFKAWANSEKGKKMRDKDGILQDMMRQLPKALAESINQANYNEQSRDKALHMAELYWNARYAKDKATREAQGQQNIDTMDAMANAMDELKQATGDTPQTVDYNKIRTESGKDSVPESKDDVPEDETAEAPKASNKEETTENGASSDTAEADSSKPETEKQSVERPVNTTDAQPKDEDRAEQEQDPALAKCFQEGRYVTYKTYPGRHDGRILVDQVHYSTAISQQKMGAVNADGTLQLGTLTAKRYNPNAPAIAVMRSKNGDLIVITGRHRLALAKAVGETAINAMVFDEGALDMEGRVQDLEWGKIFDLEANMQDEQASSYDVAKYARARKLTVQQMKDLGFVRERKLTATGQESKVASPGEIGAYIAERASDDLWDVYINGKLTDHECYVIACTSASPTVQMDCVKYRLEGKGWDWIRNYAKDADARVKEHGERNKTGELWDGESEWEKQARIYTDYITMMIHKLEKDASNWRLLIKGVKNAEELAKKGGSITTTKDPLEGLHDAEVAREAWDSRDSALELNTRARRWAELKTLLKQDNPASVQTLYQKEFDALENPYTGIENTQAYIIDKKGGNVEAPADEGEGTMDFNFGGSASITTQDPITNAPYSIATDIEQRLTDTERADKSYQEALYYARSLYANVIEDPAIMEEVVRIHAEALKVGKFLKAPNGKRSHLDPMQWCMVRTKAFKDWFGDWENDPEHSSKIVDENGEPKVVYHGTVNAGQTVRPTTVIEAKGAYWVRKNLGPEVGRALNYFTSNYKGALQYTGSYQDYGHQRDIDGNGPNSRRIGRYDGRIINLQPGDLYRTVYPCFLNVRDCVKIVLQKKYRGSFKKLIVGRDKDGTPIYITDKYAVDAYLGGKDGVWIRKTSDPVPMDQLIVYNNANIKSANFNRGTYSSKTQDITANITRDTRPVEENVGNVVPNYVRAVVDMVNEALPASDHGTSYNITKLLGMPLLGWDPEQGGIQVVHSSETLFIQPDIDRFARSGEGGQAYGHGLYGATNWEVVRDYWKQFYQERHDESPIAIYKGKKYQDLLRYDASTGKKIADLDKLLKSMGIDPNVFDDANKYQLWNLPVKKEDYDWWIQCEKNYIARAKDRIDDFDREMRTWNHWGGSKTFLYFITGKLLRGEQWEKYQNDEQYRKEVDQDAMRHTRSHIFDDEFKAIAKKVLSLKPGKERAEAYEQIINQANEAYAKKKTEEIARSEQRIKAYRSLSRKVAKVDVENGPIEEKNPVSYVFRYLMDPNKGEVLNWYTPIDNQKAVWDKFVNNASQEIIDYITYKKEHWSSYFVGGEFYHALSEYFLENPDQKQWPNNDQCASHFLRDVCGIKGIQQADHVTRDSNDKSIAPTYNYVAFDMRDVKLEGVSIRNAFIPTQMFVDMTKEELAEYIKATTGADITANITRLPDNTPQLGKIDKEHGGGVQVVHSSRVAFARPDIDRFARSGEGGQMYGHGLYGATNWETVKSYHKQFSEKGDIEYTWEYKGKEYKFTEKPNMWNCADMLKPIIKDMGLSERMSDNILKGFGGLLEDDVEGDGRNYSYYATDFRLCYASDRSKLKPYAKFEHIVEDICHYNIDLYISHCLGPFREDFAYLLETTKGETLADVWNEEWQKDYERMKRFGKSDEYIEEAKNAYWKNKDSKDGGMTKADLFQYLKDRIQKDYKAREITSSTSALELESFDYLFRAENLNKDFDELGEELKRFTNEKKEETKSKEQQLQEQEAKDEEWIESGELPSLLDEIHYKGKSRLLDYPISYVYRYDMNPDEGEVLTWEDDMKDQQDVWERFLTHAPEEIVAHVKEQRKREEEGGYQFTGEKFYRCIDYYYGDHPEAKNRKYYYNDQNASHMLRDVCGIKGLRTYDWGTRNGANTGEATFNYVAFDMRDVKLEGVSIRNAYIPATMFKDMTEEELDALIKEHGGTLSIFRDDLFAPKKEDIGDLFNAIGSKRQPGVVDMSLAGQAVLPGMEDVAPSGRLVAGAGKEQLGKQTKGKKGRGKTPDTLTQDMFMPGETGEAGMLNLFGGDRNTYSLVGVAKEYDHDIKQGVYKMNMIYDVQDKRQLDPEEIITRRDGNTVWWTVQDNDKDIPVRLRAGDLGTVMQSTPAGLTTEQLLNGIRDGYMTRQGGLLRVDTKWGAYDISIAKGTDGYDIKGIMPALELKSLKQAVDPKSPLSEWGLLSDDEAPRLIDTLMPVKGGYLKGGSLTTIPHWTTELASRGHELVDGRASYQPVTLDQLDNALQAGGVAVGTGGTIYAEPMQGGEIYLYAPSRMEQTDMVGIADAKWSTLKQYTHALVPEPQASTELGLRLKKAGLHMVPYVANDEGLKACLTAMNREGMAGMTLNITRLPDGRPQLGKIDLAHGGGVQVIHSSRVGFVEPDIDNFAGSGEGAQAYGHGLYGATNWGAVEFYWGEFFEKGQTTTSYLFNGEDLDRNKMHKKYGLNLRLDEIHKLFSAYQHGGYEEVIQQYKDDIKEAEEKYKNADKERTFLGTGTPYTPSQEEIDRDRRRAEGSKERAERLLAFAETLRNQGTVLEIKRQDSPGKNAIAYVYRYDMEKEAGDVLPWYDELYDMKTGKSLDPAWDRFVKHAPHKLVSAVKQGIKDRGEKVTGETLYRVVSNKIKDNLTTRYAKYSRMAEGRLLNEDIATSHFLRDVCGIKGIRQLDGYSRDNPDSDPTYNYIAFDKRDVKLEGISIRNAFVPATMFVDMTPEELTALIASRGGTINLTYVPDWTQIEKAGRDARLADLRARIKESLEAWRKVCDARGTSLDDRLKEFGKVQGTIAQLYRALPDGYRGSMERDLKYASRLANDTSAHRVDKNKPENKMREVVERLIQQSQDKLDRYIIDQERLAITAIFKSLIPKKNDSGKTMPGKMDAEAYKELFRVWDYMNMDAEAKAKKQDELRGALAGELDPDKQDEIENDLADVTTFGDIRSMGVEQTRTVREAFEKFTKLAKMSWADKQGQEKMRLKLIREKIRAEIASRLGGIDDIKAKDSKEDEDSVLKKAEVFSSYGLMNLAQLWQSLEDNSREESALRDLCRQSRTELAQGNIYLINAKNRRLEQMYELACHAWGVTGRTAVAKKLEAWKRSGRTGVRLDAVHTYKGKWTIEQVAQWVNMTYAEREEIRQKHKEEAEAKGVSANDGTMIPEPLIPILQEKLAKHLEEVEAKDGRALRRQYLEAELIDRGNNEGVELVLSPSQAMYTVLLWEQKDLRQGLESQGLTEGKIQRLREFIGDAGLAYGYGLRTLANEQGKALARVYEEREGIPFPQVDNYFRAVFRAEHKEMGEARKIGEGTNALTGGAKWGMLIERKKHALKLDYSLSADTVFLAAGAEVDCYIATGALTRKWRRLLAEPETAGALKTALGPTGYKTLVKWMDIVDGAGMAEAGAMIAGAKMLSKLQSAKAMALLGWNVLTILKQTSGLLNGAFANEVSMGAWLKEFPEAMLGRGRMNAVQMMHTNAFKVRMRDRQAGMIEELTSLCANGHYSRIKQLAELGMEGMEKMDVFTNAVSMSALYNAKFKELQEAGCGEVEADELAMRSVERALELNAQPIAGTQKSFMSQSSNMFGKLSFFMGSEVMNKFGQMITLLHQKEWIKAASMFATYSLAEQFVIALWHWLGDDDQDWEKNGGWYGAMRGAPTAMLGSMPLMGSTIDYAWRKMTGEKVYSGSGSAIFDYASIWRTWHNTYKTLDDANNNGVSLNFQQWASLLMDNAKVGAMLVGPGMGSKNKTIDSLASWVLSVGTVSNLRKAEKPLRGLEEKMTK